MSSPAAMRDVGRRPIDRGWSWMVVLGASVCMFFMVGGIRSLGILQVEFLQRYNASTALSSLALGLVAAGLSLVAPFANILGSQLGYRYVTIFGSFSCALALILTSFAPNIMYVIVVFGVLTGLGYGTLFGPSLCAVGMYFDKRRSLANGLAVAGGSVGQLVIPLFTRYLLDEYGFTGALILLGAFALHIIPASLLMRTPQFYMVKNKRGETGSKSSPLKEVKTNGTERHNSLTASMGDSNSNLSDNMNRHMYKKLNQQTKGSYHDHNVMINGRPKSLVETQIPEETQLMLGDHHHLKVTPIDSVKERLMRSTSSIDNLKERLRHSITDLRQTLDEKYVSTRSLDIVALEQDPPGVSRNITILSDKDEERGGGICSCCCKGSKKKETDLSQPRQKLIDWSLLKNYLFIIYLLGNCSGNAGYITGCMYLPLHAENIGIDKKNAAFLLALVGFTDLGGRIVGGWFADLGLIKRCNIMAFCMCTTGVVSIICMFFPSYPCLIFLSCVYGLIGGFFVSLIAVVLVDFLGLAAMSQAFGISIMCQGLFTMGLPTILGLTKDKTGNFMIAYFINGGLMIISAVFFALEPCARRLQEGFKNKEENKDLADLDPSADTEDRPEDKQRVDQDFLKNPLKDAFVDWEMMDRETVI